MIHWWNTSVQNYLNHVHARHIVKVIFNECDAWFCQLNQSAMKNCFFDIIVQICVRTYKTQKSEQSFVAIWITEFFIVLIQSYL